MPRYFLHLRDGERSVEDAEGSVFPDLEAAVAEAEAGARDILAAMLKGGEPLDGQRIEIADAAGTVLATVRFKEVFRLG